MPQATSDTTSDPTSNTGPDSRHATGALEPVLARNPGHLLWRAAARVDQALGEVLPAGFDVHAYAALIALDAPTALSQQELADRIGVSGTTMGRVAAALTDAALVERVRNPDDRRSYALTRTPAGARAAQEWRHHAGALEDRLVRDLSAAEVGELRELMHDLAEEDLHALTPPGLTASIGFLVVRVHARAHRDFGALLEPLGIAPRDFGTLSLLGATGPVSQSDLARMLGVSGATVVQIVDDLERVGLAERQRDPDDRRTQLVHPTGSTSRALARAHELVRSEPSVLHDLDRDRTERLIDLLGRFVTAP